MGFADSAKSIEEQIPVLWQRVEEAQKLSIEARTLAKHLNDNVMEAVVLSREASEISKRMDGRMTNLENKIDEKFNRLIEMQRSQFYKMIGLIIFALGTFISVGLAFWK